MRTQRLIITFIAVLMAQLVEGQIFTTVIDETSLHFRVKQIDEFFDRFNYKINYKGEVALDSYNTEERRKNFLTLINLDKYFNEKRNIDSTAALFVSYVIDNNIKIHYEDSTWFAEAFGSLLSEGKRYDVTYILKPERIKDVMYKWVITEIHSSLFESFPQKIKGSITISPAEHGVNFITIPETFNLNKTTVGTAFSKKYQRDNLVVFDYLMATGKIKLKSISKVKFHFQLKKFDFEVERVEKEKGYNQGWLINKIIIKDEK